MNENELKGLLRSADDNTVEKIGESCPATDEATKDRIWQKIAAKDSQPADFSQVEISVAEPAKPTHWGRYAVAAAAVLVIGCSAVFALRHMPPMPQEPAVGQATMRPMTALTSLTPTAAAAASMAASPR